MVARSPPKQRREMVAPPLPDPTLLRETVKKVDKCMVRLQELQYTVACGRKVISGTRLSPTTTPTYFRTKQESLKIKTGNPRRISPSGKLPSNAEEWRRMSLPAMLLGETVGEILQATQFARNIVQAEDPRTPEMVRRKHKETMEHCQLHARRKREKQMLLQATRSQSDISSSSSFQRAKSRIDFKKTEFETENCSRRYIANRVSPRNRPWARKTVLFPNPLFHSSSPTSPLIARNRQNGTKFLIKPQTPAATSLADKSQRVAAAMLRRSFSPSRLAKRLVSPLKIRNGAQTNGDASSTAAKMRRSFSPSMVASRLVSPLKGRSSVQKKGAENVMNYDMRGLKQRI